MKAIRWRWIAVSLALALLAAGLYLPVGGHEFLDYDDAQYVRDNQQVRGGLSRDGIAWAFTSLRYASNWHPLTWLSHMLDVELFGLAPAGHHLVNVALHAANTVLLFLVLGVGTAAFWRSAVVAALFAVHPLHVESVAWVAERKDVLSTLFWLLAAGAYLRYTRRPGVGRYAAVFVLLALGLMAKPMLVTLPLVLLLLDWWPLGRLADPAAARDPAGRSAPHPVNRSWSLLAEKLPLAALSALAGVLTLIAQRRGGSMVPSQVLGLPSRVQNALVTYASYLEQTLWPSALAVFYPLQAIPVWKLAAAALLLAGVSWTAARRARRSPWLLTGWLWYLVTLLPVIGLIQVGTQARADRYTYLPIVGFFLMLVWTVPAALGNRRWARPALAAAGGLVLLGCSAITRQQIASWRDDTTLFTRALAVAPDNADARYNLGRSLLSRKRTEEAAIQLRRAVELAPDYATAWSDLGLALKRLKRPREAVAAFERAISLDPAGVMPYMNLGMHYLSVGDKRRARQVQQALQRVDAQAAEGLGRFIQTSPGG
jgi:tetratricopeptide (TPR) repeat protein